MQNIDLIAIGKMNAAYFAQGVAEYQKRLGGFCNFRIIELPEVQIADKNASDRQIAKALQKEGETILASVRRGAYLVALCVEGKQVSSEDLAAMIADRAMSGAGALGLDDGAVRAAVDAAAALDAETLVNVALAVAEADGVLRADLLAGVRQAALAHGRDLDDLLRAGVAGKLDDIDQRRLVVLVCNDAVLQALAGGHALIQRTQGHAHGQTDALGDDGSLQEDAAAQRFFLTGNDLEGQLTHQLFVVGKLVDLIGHAGNLSEHLATDIRYGGVNASHVIAPLFCSVCSKSDVSAGTPAPVKILPKIHTFCKRAGNKKTGKSL